MTGVWVLLGTLVVAVAAGLLLKARNGRVRAAKPAATARPLPAPVAEALDPASAVTLVQISTTFCAPCRHTRVILSALAEKTDGLHHVDLDVTEQPEVAQALSVLRTPTTLALAADGRELLRVGGVPKGPELLAALQPHLTGIDAR
ncbi:TlpA family protein disulfide reductase [Amycolatopsis saalfeldensis]|uniref:Thiol-disulfide isomerase or thioredoxin n=1 Tax=Amycolatopsis saalfeldensis TaxID=394193 RepID=A0A1H8YJQ0_9PSEU|nr:thioredoxin family protein [Amycolatopsis saalfeldensis]SEP52313.1 Thiol-disulfide isomerase or thioredoxin [Amycolatopsis saalfeldensis]